MSFQNDNSTQLNITSVSYLASYTSITNPSILFSDRTSGIYNSTSNTIILYTNNTNALTIDSNQCLYGNGTGLTHIQYTNIDNTPSLSGYATNTNLNNLSTQSYLDIPNIKTTSTTIFNNLNSLSTNSTLLINNKTNFSNLLCSGASTLLSSLNVSGYTTLNNNSTCLSSLNVSGLATMNNLNVNTSLNVSGINILTSISNIQTTKSQFYFNLTNTNTIILNSITYYKWDININAHTNTLLMPDGTTTFRKFNIYTWVCDCQFNNSEITENEYSIFMSSRTTTPNLGLNICASGPFFGVNKNLKRITGNHSIIQNDFNTLTYVCTTYNISIGCIINDTA